MIKTVCIAGAGTMGSGIAQVAAQSGFDTILYDINEDILHKGKSSIESNLQSLINKKKISVEEKESILRRITFSSNINDCIGDLVIEAIIEKAEAKIEIFNQLMQINKSETIFASNTSSLSINQIQAGIKKSTTFAGMHFFNPAPVMKLVEIVKGSQTNDETIETIFSVCKTMNKIPVVCNDSPGFIVNRIARHYYLEAMKLVEQKIATIENVDSIMEANGFKMGPFRLMDLIGIDINLAVSESIYGSLQHEKRFKPSSLQIKKVQAGELGKKTGKGFYNYNG